MCIYKPSLGFLCIFRNFEIFISIFSGNFCVFIKRELLCIYKLRIREKIHRKNLSSTYILIKISKKTNENFKNFIFLKMINLFNFFWKFWIFFKYFPEFLFFIKILIRIFPEFNYFQKILKFYFFRIF